MADTLHYLGICLDCKLTRRLTEIEDILDFIYVLPVCSTEVQPCTIIILTEITVVRNDFTVILWLTLAIIRFQKFATQRYSFSDVNDVMRGSKLIFSHSSRVSSLQPWYTCLVFAKGPSQIFRCYKIVKNIF